ncbi:MAG: hypothetical protein V9E83_13605 [Baekduia sp.]
MLSLPKTAAAGITAATFALSLAVPAIAANVYEVDGSGTRGGTPSKPKAAKLSAEFTVATDNDSAGALIPEVISTYSFAIEGGKLDKRVLAKLSKCKVSAEGADQDDAQCPKSSIVGKGQLSAAVGTPGALIQKPSFFCTLPFNIYNTGKDIALFIRATTKVCPTAVTQWIKQTTTQKGRTVVTSFTTPENLQLVVPPSLYASVTQANFTLSPKYAKIKGKKTSATQSIGCSDKKRDVAVTFTTRTGQKTTVKKTVAC